MRNVSARVAGNVRGAGNGFNQLFPLGHKYFGFMDLYDRSNIQSPNLQLTFQPAQRLNILIWYYYLFLDSRRDTPYTVLGTPFQPGSQPASRRLAAIVFPFRRRGSYAPSSARWSHPGNAV